MEVSLNLIKRANELINEAGVRINAEHFIDFDEKLSQIKLIQTDGRAIVSKPYFEVFE